MGPGFHGNSHIQRSVDLAVILSRRRGLHSEDADANAVEAEFDVVGPGEAFDMLVAVARQPQLNLILGVLREGVVDGSAAAGAER